VIVAAEGNGGDIRMSPLRSDVSITHLQAAATFGHPVPKRKIILLQVVREGVQGKGAGQVELLLEGVSDEE
jgi:hypothetical protein